MENLWFMEVTDRILRMLHAVKFFGWAHGVLFVARCFMLLKVTLEERWPIARGAMVFIAAPLRFGPFVIDKRLEHYE